MNSYFNTLKRLGVNIVQLISSYYCATGEETARTAEKTYKKTKIFFIAEMVFYRIGAFTNMKVDNIRGNGEIKAHILLTDYLRD